MTDQLHFKSRAAWRAWLKKNHASSDGLWLIFHKKHSPAPCVSYAEAVEEALCFGWIDSILKRIDDATYRQRFTPRRPGSKWSELNKSRARKMIDEKKMTRAGLDALGIALESDTRTARPLYKTAPTDPPPDFAKALRSNRTAQANWEAFAASYKRRYIAWITSAKQPATRAARIAEAVTLIAENVKSLMK
jgi:uncharacterized protein YdeI (YjbR/CyaY-like superfamily)